jgi:hypothetical protein
MKAGSSQSKHSAGRTALDRGIQSFRSLEAETTALLGCARSAPLEGRADNIERPNPEILGDQWSMGYRGFRPFLTHRSNIMEKLAFHSVTELVLYAIRNNIVQVSTNQIG